MSRASCWFACAAMLAAHVFATPVATAQQLNWIHARTPSQSAANSPRVAAPAARPIQLQSRPMISARDAANRATPPAPTPDAPAPQQHPQDAAVDGDVVPVQHVASYDYPAIGPSCGISGCADGCCEPTCGFMGDPSCGIPACGGDCCGGCGCGEPCGCGDTCAPLFGGCANRGCTPLVLFLPPARELAFFAGVQGHTGPLDQNRDGGNFGFNEGFNLGGEMAWLPWPGLGYQIGFRGTQNQLSGDERLGTSGNHSQQFFTAGLFRRCNVGWQYGLVYDMVRDERWESADYSQVRGQLSVVNPQGGEIGFMFASNTNENELFIPARNNVIYQATNQYLLFYRMRGCQGGEFSFAIGADDDSKGLLKSEFQIPLSSRWSLETGATYLIPENDNASPDGREEAWNIGMNFVWHYGCSGQRWYRSPYRPLFNVADNGSLIVDDRR